MFGVTEYDGGAIHTSIEVVVNVNDPITHGVGLIIGKCWIFAIGSGQDKHLGCDCLAADLGYGGVGYISIGNTIFWAVGIKAVLNMKVFYTFCQANFAHRRLG